MLYFLLHILSGNILLQLASFLGFILALLFPSISPLSVTNSRVASPYLWTATSYWWPLFQRLHGMFTLSVTCLTVLASSSPRDTLIQLLHVGGDLHEEKFRITRGSVLFSQCIDNRISEWETL